MTTNKEMVEVRFDLSSDHLTDIKTALYTLKLCNEKISKLETSRFHKTLQEEEFTVITKFVGSPAAITRRENTDSDSVSISIFGKIESYLPIFDQDNVDAFALTFRQLTQNNDRISIGNLSREIYGSQWLFKEARVNFGQIRDGLNQYLNSAIFLQLSKRGTISRRKLVDVILYGGLAHTNDAKEKIFRSWMDSGFSGLFWAEFFETMVNVLNKFLVIKEINDNIITIFEPLVAQLEEALEREKERSEQLIVNQNSERLK